MSHILVPVLALALSMVVIPLMLRLAPVLGLFDQPSPRKVHGAPVARVGGWGIVLGAVVPIAITLPLADPTVSAFLFGTLVLLAFGTWDDARSISPYLKLLGQVIAAAAVVYVGDVWLERIPLLDPVLLPPEIGKPLTVLALVTAVNAMNLSDGLDGLAGGVALLSLLAIVLLAYLAGGLRTTVIGLAVIGSTLGFLRYNTHPARLFMGDAGSQVLGFTTGVLVVLLTQSANQALSPAAALLILGLPLADLVVVVAQRTWQGVHWFRAGKNHLHHRLLELGFSHYEAVVLVYSAQAVFVLSGVLLRYADDALVLAVYLLLCVAVFGVVFVAQQRGWCASGVHGPSPLARLLAGGRAERYCRRAGLWIIGLGLPVYAVGEGLASRLVPRDFGVMSAVLLVVLGVELVLRRSVNSVTVRGVVYATAVFIVYLSAHFAPAPLGEWSAVDIAFFTGLAGAVGLSVRCSQADTFRTTPMDYLMLFVLVVLGILPHDLFGAAAATEIVMKGIILLYASELFLHEVRRRWNPVSLGTIAALGVMAYRGLTG